ncbi:CaiB/BaiF CoA transferase family protein [Citreimonas sp.]|uniref:CaiB/BaiF CoA transferase family protein n=1 Tax=Citreimonas sp. TaxID=3036715 RepID=UPI0040590413
MLDGVRILEFEGLGPAPFAGMLLADLGAEVTVIHRPGGGALPGGTGLLDRGKRSIALDLKDGEDIRVARALIAGSHGLIEGLRPGVMERLGFGPADAHALNPALVYGRMTGWGQTGPRAHQAGHDLTYLALSGALYHAGLPGEPPAPTPTLQGDVGGGALYLAVGMLAGVIRARETGQGTVVDAAIVDGAANMMALLASMGSGFDRAARGASLLDGPHWSRCYPCACGGHVAVQALEPQFYRLLLETLGLEGDPAMQVQHDPTQWPGQTARLAAIFAAHPRDHWAALFDGSDACVAPVLSPAEAACDAHMAARGAWQDDGAPGLAPRFDGRRATPRPVPARDGDRAAILARLRKEGML